MSDSVPRDSLRPPGTELDAGKVIRRIQAYLGALRRHGVSPPLADEEWDRFFRSHTQLFLRLLRGRRRSGDECDDGIQDLWLMLVSRLPDVQSDPYRGDLSDWIAAAVRHRLEDQERYRRSHSVQHLAPGDAERLADRGPDPAAAYERDRLRERVRDALAELRRQVAPRDYEAYTLRWVQGWRIREIARHLGMTEGQVWSSHHRTSRKLRPLLARRIDP